MSDFSLDPGKLDLRAALWRADDRVLRFLDDAAARSWWSIAAHWVRLMLTATGKPQRRIGQVLAATVTMLAVAGSTMAAFNTTAANRAPATEVNSWTALLARLGPLGDKAGVAAELPTAIAAPLPAVPTTAASAAAPAAPTPPALRGALPVGKGMWMWKPELVEGGNPEATVQKAVAQGLSHIYVRTGSSRSGFYAQQYLTDLLPRAHAAGIRIFGWDFPYLEDVNADVTRALAAIEFQTPDGHRLDGFTADIETHGEGVNITPQTASAYGTGLRNAVGQAYPLIATVPRPSAALVTYPFREVVTTFDAIAPMVYWLGRDPGNDAIAAVEALRGFGKPVMPVGQAYDGFAEGGPMGVPSRAEIQRFIQASEDAGCPGVSFWSWQHADRQAWDAIRDAPQFTLPATPPGAPIAFTPGQIRSWQIYLTTLGFPAVPTGRWDGPTQDAVTAYQRAAKLPTTGVIDPRTRSLLLTPFRIPIARMG